MPAHAQQPHHLACCRALTLMRWEELCEMSCVSCEMSGNTWDELCELWDEWSSVRWVVWVVRWVVWKNLGELQWENTKAAPPNGTRKQLLSELSCVRWVVRDELCEMSCVTCEMRGVVWDEMCALCETTWVKLREKEATQEEKEEKARNTNLKTKAPHRDVRKKT